MRIRYSNTYYLFIRSVLFSSIDVTIYKMYYGNGELNCNEEKKLIKLMRLGW